MKSGFGGGTHTAERAVFELLSASQWWSTTLDAYWRTASTAKHLAPKLKSCLEEMNSGEHSSKEWLEASMDNLKTFREGLRAGSYDEYEHILFRKVQSHLDVLTCCKSVHEAKATGYDLFVGPLEKAIDMFSSWEGAPQMKQKLANWVSSMAGEYAVGNFSSFLESLQDTQSVDWVKLSTILKSLTGSLPSESTEVMEKTKGVLHALFSDFLAQAGPLGIFLKF